MYLAIHGTVCATRVSKDALLAVLVGALALTAPDSTRVAQAAEIDPSEELSQKLQYPVTALPLDAKHTRATLALLQSGVLDLHDLVQQTEDHLCNLGRGVGPEAVKHIREALASVGLQLETRVVPPRRAPATAPISGDEYRRFGYPWFVQHVEAYGYTLGVEERLALLQRHHAALTQRERPNQLRLLFQHWGVSRWKMGVDCKPLEAAYYALGTELNREALRGGTPYASLWQNTFTRVTAADRPFLYAILDQPAQLLHLSFSALLPWRDLQSIGEQLRWVQDHPLHVSRRPRMHLQKMLSEITSAFPERSLALTLYTDLGGWEPPQRAKAGKGTTKRAIGNVARFQGVKLDQVPPARIRRLIRQLGDQIDDPEGLSWLVAYADAEVPMTPTALARRMGCKPSRVSAKLRLTLKQLAVLRDRQLIVPRIKGRIARATIGNRRSSRP